MRHVLVKEETPAPRTQRQGATDVGWRTLSQVRSAGNPPARDARRASACVAGGEGLQTPLISDTPLQGGWGQTSAVSGQACDTLFPAARGNWARTQMQPSAQLPPLGWARDSRLDRVQGPSGRAGPGAWPPRAWGPRGSLGVTASFLFCLQ